MSATSPFVRLFFLFIRYKTCEHDSLKMNQLISMQIGTMIYRQGHETINFEGQEQGDHLSGKPGNVREFDSCQGNVRDFTKNQGSVREKILSAKSCLKLFIVSCIFVSIQVFSRSLLCLKC